MGIIKSSVGLLLVCTTSWLGAQGFKKGPTFPEVSYNLKNDIVYLSSDALEGRLTGSPGEKLSAEYIQMRLKEAGLKPLDGVWFQTFEIVKLRIATQQTKFSLEIKGADPSMMMPSFDFGLFTDFYPVSISSNEDSAYAEPVFCGHGISADSLGYNDYAGIDVKGKIAIIKLGFPGDDDNPHSALAAHASLRTKAMLAIEKGAVGIIFIPGSKSAEIPAGELKRGESVLSVPVFYMNKDLPVNGAGKIFMRPAIRVLKANGTNVWGYRNNKAKNTVLVCAHHDHLGHGEFGGSLHTGANEIHNGADDNASGVATMLQLARTLKGKKYKKNNYLFLAFSGEEMGLLGSKFFVKHAPISMRSINYVVNIDMLGRLDSQSRTLVINGTGTSPNWNTSLAELKIDTHMLKIKPSESGLGASDHTVFYLDSIPVLHFFSGQHSDYHKPSDDENKINYYGMYQSYQVILQIIESNNKKGKLTFIKTKDVQPGKSPFKVTFGLMPDYTFTGGGMRIDGVSSGKPAEKAGLLKGDIITKVGNTQVGSVEDYMHALSALSKGQKVQVEFTRNGENKSIEVEL